MLAALALVRGTQPAAQQARQHKWRQPNSTTGRLRPQLAAGLGLEPGPMMG